MTAEVTQGDEEKKLTMKKTISSLGHGGSVSIDLGLGHHMRVTLITQTNNPNIEGIGGVSFGVGNGLNIRGPNQSSNMSGGTGLRNGLHNSRGPNLNNLIRINGVQTRPNGTNKYLEHTFKNRDSKGSPPGTLATNGGAADRHSATYRWLMVAEMADRRDVDSTCKHMVMVRSNVNARYPGESIVINANGLAVETGVTVAMTQVETYEAVDSMLVKGDFGSAGGRVIVEEFLEGAEVSFFAMVDGENAIPLESAQDHRRVGEGDTAKSFSADNGIKGFQTMGSRWKVLLHYLPFLFTLRTR